MPFGKGSPYHSLPIEKLIKIQFFSLIKGFCFWPQVVQGQPFPEKLQQTRIISSAAAMFIGSYKV